jgi:hypothetical protein
LEESELVLVRLEEEDDNFELQKPVVNGDFYH